VFEGSFPRSTLLRKPAAQGRICFELFPALIPHPGEPGLGNVPGYYQTSREARDWGFLQLCG
jgi:hypothetical protein